jgi:hypothetical protein
VVLKGSRGTTRLKVFRRADPGHQAIPAPWARVDGQDPALAAAYGAPTSSRRRRSGMFVRRSVANCVVRSARRGGPQAGHWRHHRPTCPRNRHELRPSCRSRKDRDLRLAQRGDLPPARAVGSVLRDRARFGAGRVDRRADRVGRDRRAGAPRRQAEDARARRRRQPSPASRPSPSLWTPAPRTTWRAMPAASPPACWP